MDTLELCFVIMVTLEHCGDYKHPGALSGNLFLTWRGETIILIILSALQSVHSIIEQYQTKLLRDRKLFFARLLLLRLAHKTMC